MSAFSEPMKNRLKVLLFTAPLLVPLFTFWLVPFGYSIYISFTDWDYISPDYSFIGLENYEYMVEDYEFIQAVLNTFWFSVGVVIPTIILGLVFAMLLHKNFKGSQFYRAVIFSPWITPTVAWGQAFDVPENGKKRTVLTVEISANPMAAAGSQQQWMKTLQAVGADRVRSQTTRSGKASVDEIEVDGVRMIKVSGFIDAGKLVLPGGKFRITDRKRISDLLQKFRDDGSETTLAPKHAFGLTADEIKSLNKKLSTPVAESTKGKPVADVIHTMTAGLGVNFVRDAAATSAMRRGATVENELQGLSTGTALAAIVKPLGLVIQPQRKQGQAVQVDLRSAIKSKESWPIGWELSTAPVLIEPKLFDKMPIKIKNFPLDKVLEALQKKVDTPFVLDYETMQREGIDLAKTKVSLEHKNGTIKVIMGKLLRQTKPRMSEELRIDENGKPFLWITAK